MKKVIISLGVIAIIFLVLVMINILSEENSVSSLCDLEGVCPLQNFQEFNVEAFRFGYTPDTIYVKEGNTVKINIDNVDTPHGIRIPDFDVKGESSVEFLANKKGEFTWHCLIPCGSGHMVMNGTIIVE